MINQEYPKGTCELMCPEAERIFREKEGLLHILEIVPGTERKPLADINRVVKEFSRSAAGRKAQDEEILRTVDALLITINYLLHEVVTKDYIKWNVIYDFVMDRLRAVRQDMVIQSFARPDTICMLQPMVRFYAYADYRLCEEPIEVFDPVLNKKHLLECLKRLLRLYDDADILLTQFDLENETSFKKVKDNILYADSRPFMEALYLIMNLGNTIAMERAMKLPKIWKTELVLYCFKISLECWRGNYIKVCKMMPKLPPLLLATASLVLPSIRRKCLSTMSIAYNTKNLPFPVDILQKLLLYNDRKEVIEDCTYYHVPRIDNDIIFSKQSFNFAVRERNPKRVKLVDDVLADVNIPHLLLYDY